MYIQFVEKEIQMAFKYMKNGHLAFTLKKNAVKITLYWYHFLSIRWTKNPQLWKQSAGATGKQASQTASCHQPL